MLKYSFVAVLPKFGYIHGLDKSGLHDIENIKNHNPKTVSFRVKK